jgi:hypothetical protein
MIARDDSNDTTAQTIYRSGLMNDWGGNLARMLSFGRHVRPTESGQMAGVNSLRIDFHLRKHATEQVVIHPRFRECRSFKIRERPRSEAARISWIQSNEQFAKS